MKKSSKSLSPLKNKSMDESHSFSNLPQSNGLSENVITETENTDREDGEGDELSLEG
jgi:hypothetical protein